ncbi:alginate O-acetyltransferase AlgX-related protein [Spirosoma pomorum]
MPERKKNTQSGARVKSGYKAFLISIGFILILGLPLIDQWAGWSSGFKSTEKRILTPFPRFDFPHVKTFIVQFDQYYKENFGWRNALFYQYSQWKYKGLSSSPLPEKVIAGKNGWFYPGNSMSRVAEQHRGLLPIRQDTLVSIAKRLKNLQDSLSRQGTKLYLLVAPDSYTIYPENLPDYFPKEKQVSNLDRFKAYMDRHSTVPIIDVRQKLVDAKKKHVVYCQTDTHWNDYGALLATLTSVDRIRQDFPYLTEPDLSNYTITPQKGVGGDLVTMLALNDQVADSVSYKIRPAASLIAQNTEVNDKYIGLPSQRFVCKAKDSARLPKLLLVGDSFSYSMDQFMSGYFSESYMVRSHKFDLTLARTERPDIVLIEIVERNIGLLGLL